MPWHRTARAEHGAYWDMPAPCCGGCATAGAAAGAAAQVQPGGLPATPAAAANRHTEQHMAASSAARQQRLCGSHHASTMPSTAQNLALTWHRMLPLLRQRPGRGLLRCRGPHASGRRCAVALRHRHAVHVAWVGHVGGHEGDARHGTLGRGCHAALPCRCQRELRALLLLLHGWDGLLLLLHHWCCAACGVATWAVAVTGQG
jgi:hypothetical protein